MEIQRIIKEKQTIEISGVMYRGITGRIGKVPTALSEPEKRAGSKSAIMFTKKRFIL